MYFSSVTFLALPKGYLVKWVIQLRGQQCVNFKSAGVSVWFLSPVCSSKVSLIPKLWGGVERQGLFLEPTVHYCYLPYFLHAKGMGLREYPLSIKYSNTIELIIWLKNELCPAQGAHSEYSVHPNMHILPFHHKKNCVKVHQI